MTSSKSKTVRRLRKSSGLGLEDWRTAWSYRALLKPLVARDLSQKYRQTIIGPLWIVVQAIALTGVFSVVVSYVLDTAPSSGGSVLFVMPSIIVWSYFSFVIQQIANVYIVNEYWFRHIYFPRVYVPLSTAISALVSVILQFAVMFVIALVQWLHGSVQIAPLGILGMVAGTMILVPFTLGMGLAIASTTARYRDMANATPLFLQLVFFATPIVYSADRIPAPWRDLAVVLNPLVAVVDLWRSPFMSPVLSAVQVALGVGASIAMLVLGAVAFRVAERTAVDTI